MRAVLIVVRIGIAGTVTVAAIGGHAEAEDRDHVVFLARLRHCFGFFRAGGALALQGLLNGQGAVPADGDIHGCSVGVPAAGVIGITAASRIASAATRISAARVTAAGITAARVTSWIAAAGKTDAATPAHPTSPAAAAIVRALRCYSLFLRPGRVRQDFVNVVVSPLRVISVFPGVGGE